MSFNGLDEKLIKKGREWVEAYFAELARSRGELYHYGVKGMKWGVRRTPEQLGHKKRLKKSQKRDTIKVTGHAATSKRGIPHSVVDRVSNAGVVTGRSFYDKNGWKTMEIHTDNHGNPKKHPYGKHGEHIHYYEWDYETGNLPKKRVDDIPDNVRKENEDIL